MRNTEQQIDYIFANPYLPSAGTKNMPCFHGNILTMLLKEMRMITSEAVKEFQPNVTEG